MFFSAGPFCGGVFTLVSRTWQYFVFWIALCTDCWLNNLVSLNFLVRKLGFLSYSLRVFHNPVIVWRFSWPYTVCFVAICSAVGRFGVFQYLPIWYFPHYVWYLAGLISGHPDRVGGDTIESLGWLKALHTNYGHNLQGRLGLFRLDS